MTQSCTPSLAGSQAVPIPHTLPSGKPMPLLSQQILAAGAGPIPDKSMLSASGQVDALVASPMAFPDTPRTTESALEMPSLGQTVRIVGRAFRLRCPHCAGAPVLAEWRGVRHWSAVRERCTSCGLRYERSDDHYFGGAMFVNLMAAELLFAVTFVAMVLMTWPAVPWDALTYGGAASMVIIPALLYPLSKVLWLAVDVLVRPVEEGELG